MTPLNILSCWLTIHEHLPTGCHSRLSTRCSLAQDNPFHSSEWCISVECVLGNSSQLYRNKNIEVGLLLSIRNSQQPWHGFQRPYLSNCLVMAAFKSKNPTVEFFLQLHWFCMGWNCSSWVIASGSFGFFQSHSMESSSTQDLFLLSLSYRPWLENRYWSQISMCYQVGWIRTESSEINSWKEVVVHNKAQFSQLYYTKQQC